MAGYTPCLALHLVRKDGMVFTKEIEQDKNCLKIGSSKIVNGNTKLIYCGASVPKAGYPNAGAMLSI